MANYSAYGNPLPADPRDPSTWGQISGSASQWGSSVKNGLGGVWNDLSGKKGYDTLAAGAQDVSNRGMQFSQDQWDRQMQGLDRAQGAYQPSMDYWNNQYGSQGAGAGEQWYLQNGSQYNNPQRTSSAYDASRAWAGDPNQNATQGGAWQAQGYMGQANGANNAYSMMGSTLQQPYYGPQNGAQQWAQSQPQYNQAGAAENFNTKNQLRYNQQTNADASYGQIAPRLLEQGKTAAFSDHFLGGLDEMRGEVGKQTWAHEKFANAQNALAKNEAENKGLIRGADQAHDYYDSQAGALAGPGQYENFVSSDINGTNPLYERTRDRGIASINQEMARRGGFSSGAAVDRIGNYTAELDAQDYQNRANRAKDAQQMQLSRIAQGSQSAQGAAGVDIQRGTALGGLDTANEQAGLGRQNFGLNAEKQDQDFAIGISRLGLDSAAQADKANLDRLMGAGQLSSQADASNLNLLNAGQRSASDAQSQQLQRLMGGMNASGQVDQNQANSNQQALARMMASFNMAQGSDASNMAKAQQSFNMGQGVDQSNYNRYNMLGQQGQAADQFDLSRLLGQGTMAFNSQNAEEQRKQQAMAQLFGINNGQANTVGNFYGNAGQLSGSAMSDSLNALMAMYGHQAESQNAGSDFFQKLLGSRMQGGGDLLKFGAGAG